MNIYVTVVFDSIKTVLYFPVWWYSRGFFMILKKLFNSLESFDNTVGFSIWLKNIFTPIYGENDFAGRVLSFFLRVVNIIIRGLTILVYLVVIIILIFFWCFIPVYAIYKIFNG